MHAALIVIALVQFGIIGVLGWYVYQLKIGAESFNSRLDAELQRVIEVEDYGKSIGELSADLEELRKSVSDDNREVGSRITELSGEIEKLRRKSQHAPGQFAFGAARTQAERGSLKSRDPKHDQLVSLAEG